MRGAAEALASPNAVLVIDGETVAGFPENLVEPVEGDFDRPLSCLSSATATPASDTPARGRVPTGRPVRQLGTSFDERLDFRAGAGDRLTEQVTEMIAAVEDRQRGLKATDQANRVVLVRKILANAFRCYVHRAPAWVAYFRKASGYKRNGLSWLNGEAMGKTVDLMQRAGLLELSTGFYGFGSGEGEMSKFAMTPKLYVLAITSGLGANSLVLPLRRDQLVRLRERDGHAPIIFGSTPETEVWTDLLEQQNAFIARQDIGVSLTAAGEAHWIDSLNKMVGTGMPAYYRPELIQTDLYRLFNDDFDRTGRMYGGWWQDAPKEVRPFITINGKPTVELDFSGCAIRMLYHDSGFECPDDPYELGPVTAHAIEHGIDPRDYRDTHKKVLQAIINGKRPANVIRKHDLPIPPTMTPSQIVRLLKEKHFLIADSFGTGAGIYLQRKESDLALEIITAMRLAGAVCLPVHDSFLTDRGNEALLRQIMASHYEWMFHHDPVIERK